MTPADRNRLRAVFDWLEIVQWVARENDFLCLQLDRMPRVRKPGGRVNMAAAWQWQHCRARVGKYIDRIADAIGCANGVVYSSRLDESRGELLYRRSP